MKVYCQNGDKRFRHRILILSLLCTVLTVSCAPTRPKLGEPVSQDVASALLRAWQNAVSGISSIQGLASVKVKAPLTSVNGTQVILAQKPDKLRAETLSPFGVPLLTLATDAGQLSVLLPAQNLYYTGTANPQNMDLFVHLPLPVDDLVGLLLHQPPLMPAWKEQAFARPEGGWLLVRHSTLRRQELVFDPAQRLVAVSFFEDNDLLIKVEYAQFTAPPPGFPTLITLDLPAKYATIRLEFSEIDTKSPPRPGVFDVTPPAGVKIVYLPD